MLCKEYPVLAQYEPLNTQSTKTQGYLGEQRRKQPCETAAVIMTNKELMNSLQKTLPKVAKAIQ